jgi:hypothetical protein
MRRRLAIVLTLAVAVFVAAGPGVALASWLAGGTGAVYAGAGGLTTGATPTASVTGRNVSVTWSASQLPDATDVNGYQILRYDDGTDLPQSVGSACSGTVITLTCTEAGVDPGVWYYTVTPKQHQWLGTEGSPSASVVVDAPALTLAPTNVTALPAALTGTATGYITGETITFRLDDPTSGTVLSGSSTPSPIPQNGQASVSVTIPNGTSIGGHVVYAVGSGGTVTSQAIGVLANDSVAPTVSVAVVGKTAGGVGGYVKQGGAYYIYANVTDGGSPATGVASVTADVSSLTSGQTAVALSSGSWTVEGVAYNFRSSSKTVTNPTAAGSKSFSITAKDAIGNTTNQGGFSVTVDNTVPTGTDIQTTNVGGGTNGKAETGDTATFTFSEPMEPIKFLAGWTGASTPVTFRLVNNAGGDRIQIYNAANTSALPFGTVKLNRTDYTTATVSFTNSTMVMSGGTVTVTLGTPSGAVATAAATATTTWTPSTTPTDRASNKCANTTVTESGAADKEF